MNTRNWRADTLYLITIFLAIGCAPQTPFKSFYADDAESAIVELIRRREAIGEFKASLDVEAASHKRAVRFMVNINLNSDNEWNLHLKGPLGMEMGRLTFNRDSFWVASNNLGANFSGTLSQPLEIPELQLALPSLVILEDILLPMVNLPERDRWQLIDIDGGDGSTIILRRMDRKGAIEDAEIDLEFKPLRVLGEIRRCDGTTLFSRRFYYDGASSIFPANITVETADLLLSIVYHSVRLTRRSGDA